LRETRCQRTVGGLVRHAASAREAGLKDIRYAFRNLRKHPTFASVAVLTIALGIGSVTSIFSVVDAVLIQDLPFEEPGELVRVWSTNRERGVERGPLSPPDIADFEDRNRTLTALAAYSEAELALIDLDGAAVKVTGTWAADNLFAVLGSGAMLGRSLTDGDGEPGAQKVIVLGHEFWRSRFAGNPDVLGQSLTVEEDRYTVVGVMPPGFDFPGASSFWLNRHLLAYPGRYARWMDVVGRLAPGVGVQAARADFAGVARQLEEEYPGTNRAYTTTMLPLHDAMVGDTRATMLVLLGATGLLLLVACVNVINLLLSRMADRGQEIALRTALGAGRARLSRQLLTESLVLAGVGALIGTVIARIGIGLLASYGPANLPRLDEVALDLRVLLVTLAATGLTGLIFGLAPVLRLAHTDVRASLQEGSHRATGGVGRERVRSALVVAQVALAVMLVVGAGLLSRSFIRLLDTEPGFDATSVLTLRVDLPSGAYQDLERVSDFHAEMVDRLSGLPGVSSVAATATLPFDREVPFLGNFLIRDRVAPEQGEEPRAHYRQVSPGYFATMDIDVTSGREFDGLDDRESKGVAVVSSALARRYFLDEDPIGKVIEGLPPHVALGGFLTESFEIVGVAEDVKYFGLAQPSEPSLYLPVAQAPFRRMSFTLRTTAEAETLMATARAEFRAVDPTVPVSKVSTMERIVSASVARERFSTMLLALFAAVALVLAAIGVYGVISYSVSQRTSELGIRVAMGAEPRDVLRLVLLDGIRLTLAGVGSGLVGAALLSRVMVSQLYGVSATDPVTFATVAAALTVVALIAAYIPARRSARMDPVWALYGDGG
jgi:putative ABC transport system permease protein